MDPFGLIEIVYHNYTRKVDATDVGPSSSDYNPQFGNNYEAHRELARDQHPFSLEYRIRF